MSDAINKALDLVNYNDTGKELAKVEEPKDEQIANEIEYARENLYSAVEASQQVVQDMLTIAQQSQHPKAYEVLNSSIKTLSDVAMNIAELQMKKQRLLTTKTPQGEEGQTINNNLFVGSTAELQQMLANMQKGSDE